MRGEVVDPVEPVLARAVGGGPVTCGLQRGDVLRVRQLVGRFLVGAVAVALPPGVEEQEHADAVHDQPVVADVEDHAVVGEDGHLGGDQRHLVGGEHPMRALLAQFAADAALFLGALLAQVEAGDPGPVLTELGDLAVVADEAGAQAAVRVHDRFQR